MDPSDCNVPNLPSEPPHKEDRWTIGACRHLWGAVIAFAVRDAVGPDRKEAYRAMEFLRREGDEFNSLKVLCEHLDLDAEAIRERVLEMRKNGKKQTLKARQL